MISTIKIPRAYSEVYSFIDTLGIEYIEKIPSKVYNTIRDNRDKEYNPIYKKEQPIEERMLSYEALCLLSALNLQYWCDNEKEKINLKQIYTDNSKKEIEKYSYENIFKNDSKENKETIDKVEEQVALIEYKETFFKKLINKIKSLFHKN